MHVNDMYGICMHVAYILMGSEVWWLIGRLMPYIQRVVGSKHALAAM